jgi:hypothetical protein
MQPLNHIPLCGDLEAKCLTTTQAALALHGYELHILSLDVDGDGFLVQRWDTHRRLPNLDAVIAFAREAGAT